MTETRPRKSPHETLLAAFAPWTEVSVAWTEAVSELGSEVLHFVSERVRQDVTTQHRLLHARNVEDVRQIQAEFVQKAIDDYAAETGRLVEMSGDLALRLGLPREL